MRLRLPDGRPPMSDDDRESLMGNGSGLMVRETAALISWCGPDTVIDPNAQTGTIIAASHQATPIAGAYLGVQTMEQFYHVGSSMRKHLPEETRVVCQPIETSLRENRTFDLAVLVGVAEAAEDPVAIFRLARERAKMLVAASFIFIGEEVTDPDPEDVWQYDADGFSEMLVEAGWQAVTFSPVVMHECFYDYQLWSAK